MKFLSRIWLKRLALMAAIAGVLAYIAYWQFLPSVVSRVLRSKLQQVGIVDADFRIAHVSFDRLDIVAVRSSGLNVGQISVVYQPWRLLHSRLDAVFVSGAEVTIDLSGKRNSSNGLVTVDAASKKREPASSEPQPFSYLQLSACQLTVKLPGKELHLPFNATTREISGSAGSDLDLSLYLLDTPLHVTGNLNLLAGTAQLKAQVDQLNINTLLTLAPDTLNLRGGGRLSANIQYATGKTGQNFSVAIEQSDAWIARKVGTHLIGLDGLVLRADGWLNPHGALDRLATNATAQLRFDGDTSAELRVTGDRATSGHIAANVVLQSPQWQTALKDATVDGAGSAHTVFAATWTTAGVLPPAAIDLLLKSGVDAREMGSLAISGPLHAEFTHPAGGTATWNADAAALHVLLKRGDIRAPLAGLTLTGVNATGDLAIHADPRHLVATIAPWSNLAARSIEHPRTGAIVAQDEKADAADLTLTKGAGSFTYDLAAHAWAAQMPGVRVRLAGTNVGLDDQGDGLRGVGGSITFDAVAAPGSLKATLGDDAWLALDASRLRAGANEITLNPAGLLLVGAASKQPPGVTVDAKGISGSLGLVLPKGRSLGASLPGQTVAINDLRIDVDGAKGANEKPQLKANVSFDHSSAQLTSAGVMLSELSASIPLSQNAGTTPVGTFAAGAVKVGSNTWPGLSGTLGLVDGVATLTADWPIRPELKVEAMAKVNLLDRAGVTADAHAWVPKGNITDKNALASLFKSANGSEVTGAFAANATLSLQRQQLASKIELGVEHLNFSSKAFDADVSDINTNVTFDSLSPLTTPGNQQIQIASAKIGKLELSKGLTSFRVEDLHSVLIEQTSWNWAGGQLYSNAFRFDPFAPNLEMTISGDTLGVDPLVKLFAGPDSKGSGTVYGRLPVQVRWPSLVFGNGFLYATPGSGAVLLGKDAAAGVGGALSQNDTLKAGAGSNSALVKSRIVDALKDFHYDLLKLDFQNRPDDLLATLKVDGYGQIGNDKQELHLGVNAAGFDQLLRDFLVIKKALGK